MSMQVLEAALKSEADWWDGNETRSDGKAGVAVGSILFREAASELTRMAGEIERLREALTEALDGWKAAPPEDQADYDIIERLRAAGGDQAMSDDKMYSYI